MDWIIQVWKWEYRKLSLARNDGDVTQDGSYGHGEVEDQVSMLEADTRGSADPLS